MKIVCAASVYQGAEVFASLGDVEVLPDAAIDTDAVRDAEALVIRSKTAVTADLIRGSALTFVGTCTAGTDHMDLEALEAAGIVAVDSIGCNANSVAEYIVAALLVLRARRGWAFEGRTLGVVGVGHVGSITARYAEALGFRVLRNDPPRAEAEGADGFVDLETMLPQCDAVTLHTPLTDDGPHPTRGLAGSTFFDRLRPGAVFLNASRGEVVDEAALRLALTTGRVGHAVLDVWDHEPKADLALVRRAELATPHIAGYSLEGRTLGTQMVYEKLCAFLGKAPTAQVELPPVEEPDIEITSRLGPLDALEVAVRTAYDIVADDARFRDAVAAGGEAAAKGFNRLRKTYPPRREFRNYEVQAGRARPVLEALGFQVGP